ncbi:hypothetical protein [Streptomyces sasae]|uniref:hypothetical protein n=1 Tax=Streptomyces sasae TaxID=1266772 RepID=UPI00292FD17B|nr:hypothetical protein [Streptomyces sasae]
MMQVEAVVVNLARAVGRRDEKLLDIGGPGEAQDGAAAEAELPGDGPQAVAAFDAFVDGCGSLAGALRAGGLLMWLRLVGVCS